MLIWCHSTNSFLYPSHPVFPHSLYIATLQSKQTHSSQRHPCQYKWEINMGVLEQNRERERDQKRKKENIFTTDQTIRYRICWMEFKREKEWERLSLKERVACLPCMVLPRPWPNFQPCFWRSRCPMLSWCEEERKERPQYSNNKKRFPHTHTHSQVLVVARQLSKHLYSLSSTLAISATTLNSLSDGEQKGERGRKNRGR